MNEIRSYRITCFADGPKQIFFIHVMPKTATGKIQRRMIAAAMLEQHRPKAKL